MFISDGYYIQYIGTEVPDPIQDIKEAGNVVTAVRLYIHEYVNFYATH